MNLRGKTYVFMNLNLIKETFWVDKALVPKT